MDAIVKLIRGLAMLCCLIPYMAQAEDEIDDDTMWQYRTFWEGAAGALLVHELGHVLVATSYGAHPQLNRGSVVYPHAQFSAAQSVRVSSAGFQMQWLLSELAFSDLTSEQPSHPHLAQGAIAMHLAISAAYLIHLKDMPTSDIYALSQTTQQSQNSLAWWVSIPAMLDAYRLLATDVPAWLPYVSMGFKAAEVSYVWRY